MPGFKYIFEFYGAVRNTPEVLEIIRDAPIKVWPSARENIITIYGFSLFTGNHIVAKFLEHMESLSEYVDGENALIIQYTIPSTRESRRLYIGTSAQIEHSVAIDVSSYLWDLSRSTSLKIVSNAVTKWMQVG